MPRLGEQHRPILLVDAVEPLNETGADIGRTARALSQYNRFLVLLAVCCGRITFSGYRLKQLDRGIIIIRDDLRATHTGSLMLLLPPTTLLSNTARWELSRYWLQNPCNPFDQSAFRVSEMSAFVTLTWSCESEDLSRRNWKRQSQ